MLDRNKEIRNWFTSNDSVVAVRQLVHILCILYFKDVSPRELDLLCEIINVGELSIEAKKAFEISYKTNKNNTAQYLKRLSEKGILVEKRYKTGKELHPLFKEILSIKNGELNKVIVLTYNG